MVGLVASGVWRGMVADLGLPQVPSLPGRQFIQGFLAFTQAQPRHAVAPAARHSYYSSFFLHFFLITLLSSYTSFFT